MSTVSKYSQTGIVSSRKGTRDAIKALYLCQFSPDKCRGLFPRFAPCGQARQPGDQRGSLFASSVPVHCGTVRAVALPPGLSWLDLRLLAFVNGARSRASQRAKRLLNVPSGLDAMCFYRYPKLASFSSSQADYSNLDAPMGRPRAPVAANGSSCARVAVS